MLRWLWEALSHFSNEDMARFVQFITGRVSLIHSYPHFVLDQPDPGPEKYRLWQQQKGENIDYYFSVISNHILFNAAKKGDLKHTGCQLWVLLLENSIKSDTIELTPLPTQNIMNLYTPGSVFFPWIWRNFCLVKARRCFHLADGRNWVRLCRSGMQIIDHGNVSIICCYITRVLQRIPLILCWR